MPCARASRVRTGDRRMFTVQKSQFTALTSYVNMSFITRAHHSTRTTRTHELRDTIWAKANFYMVGGDTSHHYVPLSRKHFRSPQIACHKRGASSHVTQSRARSHTRHTATRETSRDTHGSFLSTDAGATCRASPPQKSTWRDPSRSMRMRCAACGVHLQVVASISLASQPLLLRERKPPTATQT